MPKKKRPTAADQVAAIARGGMDALRAAESLIGNADEQIQIRVSARRKKIYQDAAAKTKRRLSDVARELLDAWAAGVG